MPVSMTEIQAVITADTSNFDSGMASAGQQVDALSQKGTAASANFGAASASMAAGAAAIGLGIADAVSMAGDFQASMNEIGAITGATTDELSGLSDLAMQIGADTSFSAGEAAQAISELGKAGIAIPDMMNGAAMATADLAAAAGVDMPRAAEVMSNSMNMFKISGDQATEVADTLAAASNASASSVDSLAYGLAQAGPSASGLGLSLQETVAQLALFSNYGMQGSDAGTSFKTMLSALVPSTTKAEEVMTSLGLRTVETVDGMTQVQNKFFDAQGNFVGMAKASELLYDAMKDMTDEERKAAEAALFGSDASRAAEITFQAQKNAVEGTGASYQDMFAAVQPAGQAVEVASAKMAGMKGALEALSGSIDSAKTAFGMAFLPAVESVARGLASLVNVFVELPKPVQQTISFVTAGAAAFLAVGSAIGFVIGPLGAVAGALAPVAAGIVAILGPLGLLVAGAVALKTAYDQNLGGFADAVNQAAADVTAALQPVIDVVNEVIAAFQTGGFSAAVDAFVAGMPRIGEAAGNVITILGDLGARAIPALVEAFRGIDWTAVGDAIGTGLQGALATLSNFGAWVLDALRGGAGGGGGAGSLAGDIGGWLRDQFVAIDWGQLGTALLDGVKRAAALLLDFSQWGLDRLGEIATFVLNAVTGADWGAISSALQTKGQELATGLLTSIQDASDQMFTWFNGMGDQILTAIGDLASLLVGKGVELFTGLNTGITQKWPEIQTWLGTLGSNILNTIGDLSATLIPRGVEAFTGLRTGIDQKWPEIQSWLGTVGNLAFDAVGSLLSTLTEHGSELMEGLYTAAGDYWTSTIAPWLIGIPPMIVATIGSLATTLLAKGTELITGFKSGVDAKWGEVTSWLASIPTLISNAIGDLGGVLFSKGADLIGGFVRGMLSVPIPNPADLIGGAASAAQGAFNSLTGGGGGNTSTYDAGYSQGGLYTDGIADGIVNGTTAVYDTAYNAAGHATQGVVTAWGIASPSKVGIALGQNFAESLGLGAEDMRAKLEEAFTGLADLIVDIFEQLKTDILAQIDATVSGVEAAAEDATAAMESLHKTATSIGGVEPGDRDYKERSYAHDMRRMDREERRSGRSGGGGADADREARVRERERHHNSGASVVVQNVNLRDERDLERWAKQHQRQTGLAGVRG